MKNASKNYSKHEKELLLTLVKVGAQNGIHQKTIAECIAPVLRRKPSAIDAQMNIQRREWLKMLKEDVALTHKKIIIEDDVILRNETEYEYKKHFAPETVTKPKPNTNTIPEPTWVAAPTTSKSVEPTPEPPKMNADLQEIITSIKDEPEMDTEVEVVVTGLTDYGAFAKVKGYSITGLIHISKIANEYIDKTSEWLYVGQHVNVIIHKRANGLYQFNAKDAPNKNVWQLGVATE